MYLCISVNKKHFSYSSYMHCTWRYNLYTHCWFLLSLLSVKKLGWSTHIYKKMNFVHTKHVCMHALSTLILNSKDWHEKNRYQIFRILMCYHRSVVLIKIYSLHHSESFPPSLLLFLFDWLTKRWKTAKEMSINCNSLYLLCHTNCQMYVNMIASSVTTTYY